LSRKVGPVNLSYGLSYRKFNPVSAVFTLPCTDRPVEYCAGGYETDWQLSHSLSAGWSPAKGLSLSASFAMVFGRSFAPAERDPATSPDYMHALAANLRDGFSFGLSASYQLPVEGLSASFAFSNGGGWRSNGQDLFNPLFDPRLAAMSLGVSYAY